jgi:CRP-like cAMP-binding protein
MARKARGALFDPNVFLATVNRDRTKLEYRSEGVIFSQGAAADSIFYILRGKIKIVVTSKQGREAVIALLGEGDFFGEGCLIAQPLRLATAISMTNANVMRVKKAEMLRLLHAEPDFDEHKKATLGDRALLEEKIAKLTEQLDAESAARLFAEGALRSARRQEGYDVAAESPSAETESADSKVTWLRR